MKFVAPIIEEEHEHSHACYEIDTVYVDFWPSPDTDASYGREIYVCSVTGEDIDLSVADPEVDRAEGSDE